MIDKVLFSKDSSKNHFIALDGLRGIAVLYVLLSHLSNAGINFIGFLNFQQTGKYGVYLFFVLSSYLLDKQIAHVLYNQKSNRLYWKNYFFRRFMRIYPLFALALLINYFLTVNHIDSIRITKSDILPHLALQKGTSIFWSIPVEFKYYFVSPLIMLSFHHFLRWNFKRIMFAITFIALCSLYAESQLHFSETSLIRYLPIFLVGTTLATFEVLKKNSLEEIGRGHKKWIGIAGIIAFSIVLLTSRRYLEFIFGRSIEYSFFLSYKMYLGYAILWGIVLFSIRYGEGPLKKFLSIKLIRLFGILSFSAYLFHMPILLYIKKVQIPILDNQFQVVLFFVLTLGISFIIYISIERPISWLRIRSKDSVEMKTKVA